MMSECIEYMMMRRFFHEEHLATKQVEGEERIKFLKPPTFHSGGKVPKDALYRDDNRLLLQLEMIPAVDILYAALGRVNTLAKTTYKESEPWHKLPFAENVGIRLIPKILHACERRGIPQNHSPGILLLYLENCEGCQWRDLVARILTEKQSALLKIERLRNQGKEDEAKLGPDDWPEYMTTAVANFMKEARRFHR